MIQIDAPKCTRSLMMPQTGVTQNHRDTLTRGSGDMRAGRHRSRGHTAGTGRVPGSGLSDTRPMRKSYA